MLYSMTGFGAAALQDGGTSVSVELKSVNNRYFKLSLRFTDGYSVFESRVESLLRNVVERGTLTAVIRIRREHSAADYRISAAVVQNYFEQIISIAKSLGQTGYAPPLERLLHLPGVTETADMTVDDSGSKVADALWRLVEQAVHQALKALQTMRRTEGEAMARDLSSNLDTLRELAGSIEETAPLLAPLYRQRLKERMDFLTAEQNLTLNDADLIREVALFADRCDISEEIVRFKSHLEQFAAFLNGKDSAGRKLDFLTQELLRETNTMGAKANDARITTQVVEIKNVIEKIREMVQNVE
ncbi:MAG: YicC family protein [Planctomycetaceae bacterium]|jgi:uncharacterized protein (TIGR00255 family)|nr:YicC family protein [Planctomycetaceae bacterium]